MGHWPQATMQWMRTRFAVILPWDHLLLLEGALIDLKLCVDIIVVHPTMRPKMATPSGGIRMLRAPRPMASCGAASVYHARA